MYIGVRTSIILLTMGILLAGLLAACGYQSGDLDRALECADGCSNPGTPDPTPTPPPAVDGKNGSSCTVRGTPDGAVILCEDGSNAVIWHGRDYRPEQPAPLNRYEVSEIVDPCGKQATYDEVLLKLANGQLLAHYWGSGNSFITTISPGSYITTDGTACRFTVTPEGEVVW